MSLILGDNIFYGKMDLPRVFGEFESGARIFGYPVTDPERLQLSPALNCFQAQPLNQGRECQE